VTDTDTGPQLVPLYHIASRSMKRTTTTSLNCEAEPIFLQSSATTYFLNSRTFSRSRSVVTSSPQQPALVSDGALYVVEVGQAGVQAAVVRQAEVGRVRVSALRRSVRPRRPSRPPAPSRRRRGHGGARSVARIARQVAD